MTGKKIVKAAMAFALATSMALGLSACSSKAPEQSSSTNTTTTTNTTTAETKTTDNTAQEETKTTTETEQTTAKADPVEIEFWGWWSSEARKPHIEHMVNSFNEAQDGVIARYMDIPWGDIFTKNIAQIAAGKPADVMAGNFGDIPYRASQDQLTALDDYMGDFSLDLFFDSYASGCIGEDGKIYAVPLVADTRFIYYNKALLAEAGVSEEAGNLPKTWDELQTLAFQLDKSNADGTLDVMGYHPILGNAGTDAWIVNANKGKLWYDPDTDKILIDTDTNKQALEYMMSYTEHYTLRVLNDYQAAFSSGMADPFCSGKLAMLSQTNAYRSAIKQNAPDLDYGVMLMPEMTTGNGHWVNGGGFTLEVPYGAKNPQASIEFIKWMTSSDIQSYWALNMGEVPTIKAMNNPTLQNDLVYIASMNALSQTHIGEYPNKISGFKDILNPEIDLIQVGQKSIPDALKDAERVIKSTYSLD